MEHSRQREITQLSGEKTRLDSQAFGLPGGTDLSLQVEVAHTE
jgi:hypothetical protein